ncbi:hypothetical protein TWF281_003727 [Arthrobotrys megalospora]
MANIFKEMGGPKNQTRLLKIFNDPEFADVILKVGTGTSQKEYYLHQAIIRTASTRLDYLCGELPMKDGRKTVLIPAFEPKPFDIVICWVYGDKKILNASRGSDLLVDVFFMAHDLGIEELQLVAMQFVIDSLKEKAGRPKEIYDELNEVWNKINSMCSMLSLEDMPLFRQLAEEIPHFKVFHSPAWLPEEPNDPVWERLVRLPFERCQRVIDRTLCSPCQKIAEKAAMETGRHECMACCNALPVPTPAHGD